MPGYKTDAGIEKIAAGIIAEHRPELKILDICYMFRDEAAISDGKVIAGRCIRVDDRNWTVHKHDFIIEIAKDVWDEATDEFRLALVDHELGHAGIRIDEESGGPDMTDEGRIRTYTHRHDIEEFEDVLERHGPYHKALRDFLLAFVKRAEGDEEDEIE